MKYTFEIKLKAVKAIKKGIVIKEPNNEISRKWGNIAVKSIYDWVKAYRQEGISGLKFVKKRGSPMQEKDKDKEIKNRINKKAEDSGYTKEEIEYILAENAYLKKLHALVQEKNQKDQKK